MNPAPESAAGAPRTDGSEGSDGAPASDPEPSGRMANGEGAGRGIPADGLKRPDA